MKNICDTIKKLWYTYFRKIPEDEHGGEGMYSAIDISKYIINKCINDNKPISNLQLQKILFYIQKNNLEKCDQPLFEDDFFAWKFGPVIPEVYYHYCGYGAKRIIFDERDATVPENHETFDNIIEDLRELKPWDLVERTHKKGGAWDRVFNNGEGYKQIIPIDEIRNYG